MPLSALTFIETLENVPEREFTITKEKLANFMEWYWEWRESKEWVRIGEGLPPKDEDVIVIKEDDFGGVERLVARLLFDGFWYKPFKSFQGVTHWRKLPNPPTL